MNRREFETRRALLDQISDALSRSEKGYVPIGWKATEATKRASLLREMGIVLVSEVDAAAKGHRLHRRAVPVARVVDSGDPIDLYLFEVQTKPVTKPVTKNGRYCDEREVLAIMAADLSQKQLADFAAKGSRPAQALLERRRRNGRGTR